MSKKLFWAYLTVYMTSSVKFIFGPVGGFLMGLSFWEIFILTALGMMSSVTLLTFFGLWLRTWWQRRFFRRRKPKRFTARSRQTVRIWRNYGLPGVALLTPILFSPVVGTMIAVSFGERKRRILFHMAWSAVFWSAVFAFVLTYWGETALDVLKPLIGEPKR